MELTTTNNQIDIFYGDLTPDDANFLRAKELQITKIGNSYLTELGAVFKEAQDRFANHDKTQGVFGQWILYLGIGRDTVYRLIERHNFVVANCDNIDVIEALPKSLSYEIAKPTANQELVNKTISGEITSLKQYKEELQRLKSENDVLKNRPPEIKEIVKEVVKIETKEIENPQTTNELKELRKDVLAYESKINGLQRQLLDLQRLEQKESEINKKFAEIDRIKQKILEAQTEKDGLMKGIEKLSEFLTRMRKIKEFISIDLFPIAAFEFGDIPDETRNELQSVIATIDNWTYTVKSKYQLN